MLWNIIVFIKFRKRKAMGETYQLENETFLLPRHIPCYNCSMQSTGPNRLTIRLKDGFDKTGTFSLWDFQVSVTVKFVKNYPFSFLDCSVQKI